MAGDGGEWTIKGCVLRATFAAAEALSGDDPLSDAARGAVVFGGCWLLLMISAAEDFLE